ncbi:hypothetical protein [Streptomyces sp. NPDC014006]|uniref:hypothetical protein n=1 Tax=Streptomyces sp. NPDC014006 TaxID=3364870 RepID=UPI0036F9F495
MNTARTQNRPVLPRVGGAAVTGAVLSLGAEQTFAWTTRHRSLACAHTDGFCFTWWDVAVVPVTVTAALIVLITVYKALDIGPRLVVVPPTVLLAPLPLVAAETAGGAGAAVVTGGLWCGSFAFAASSRFRVLGLSAAGALLLAALVGLYG